MEQNKRQEEFDEAVAVIREKYEDEARRYRSRIRVAEGNLVGRQEELEYMLNQQAEAVKAYPQISYEGSKVWNEWQDRINEQRRLIDKAKKALADARVPQHQADAFTRLIMKRHK